MFETNPSQDDFFIENKIFQVLKLPVISNIVGTGYHKDKGSLTEPMEIKEMSSKANSKHLRPKVPVRIFKRSRFFFQTNLFLSLWCSTGQLPCINSESNGLKYELL